jgi:hypothetical protein
MRRALLCPAVALLVTACGATARTSTGSPPATPPVLSGFETVSVDAHGWRETVSRAPGSATIDVYVTVTGPLTVVAGCRPPLEVWLVDRAGTRLPEPSRGIACHAVALEQVPAGTTMTYQASIQVPTAHGTYSLHGVLAIPGHDLGTENLPTVTVVV